MASALEATIADFRARLLAGDVAALARMSAAYQPVRDRLVVLVDELAKTLAGADVKQTTVLKRERAQTLLAQIEDELSRLSAPTSRFLTASQRAAAQLALSQAEALVVAQQASIAASWNRVNTRAVEAVVGRLSDGSPLREWLDRLGAETAGAVGEALVDAVATGTHPTEVARILTGKVDLAGWRLLTTTRDAIIGSYRSASLAAYAENSDVLDGWTWICALNGSCAACVHLHGQHFPLSQKFMPTHNRCRCSPCPSVKGITLPIEDGDAWFARQDASYQDRILNHTGGEDYREGITDLADFTVLVTDKRWGDRYVQNSASGARMRAERGQRRAA